MLGIFAPESVFSKLVRAWTLLVLVYTMAQILMIKELVGKASWTSGLPFVIALFLKILVMGMARRLLLLPCSSMTSKQLGIEWTTAVIVSMWATGNGLDQVLFIFSTPRLLHDGYLWGAFLAFFCGITNLLLPATLYALFWMRWIHLIASEEEETPLRSTHLACHIPSRRRDIPRV